MCAVPPADAHSGIARNNGGGNESVAQLRVKLSTIDCNLGNPVVETLKYLSGQWGVKRRGWAFIHSVTHAFPDNEAQRLLRDVVFEMADEDRQFRTGITAFARINVVMQGAIGFEHFLAKGAFEQRDGYPTLTDKLGVIPDLSLLEGQRIAGQLDYLKPASKSPVLG